MSSFKIKNFLSFFFYSFAVKIAYYICRFFFRIKIQGREKVIIWRKNNKIAFVAVARHRSLWDAVLMPIAFGGYKETILNFVAKKELHRFFQFIPFSNIYFTFVDRKKVRKSILERSIDLLVQGVNLGIYPEGTTIPQNKAMKRGILMIIKKAQEKLGKSIPIFPLNIKIIKGNYGKPKGKWQDYLLRKIKLELRIGEPVFLGELEKLIEQNLERKHRDEEMIKLLLEITDQI